MCICAHVHLCNCAFVHLCVFIFMYSCLCVFVYISVLFHLVQGRVPYVKCLKHTNTHNSMSKRTHFLLILKIKLTTSQSNPHTSFFVTLTSEVSCGLPWSSLNLLSKGKKNEKRNNNRNYLLHETYCNSYQKQCKVHSFALFMMPPTIFTVIKYVHGVQTIFLFIHSQRVLGAYILHRQIMLSKSFSTPCWWAKSNHFCLRTNK